MICPYCRHEVIIVLGALGRRYHFRCRACGGQFSATLTEEEVQDLADAGIDD